MQDWWSNLWPLSKTSEENVFFSFGEIGITNGKPQKRIIVLWVNFLLGWGHASSLFTEIDIDYCGKNETTGMRPIEKYLLRTTWKHWRNPLLERWTSKPVEKCYPNLDLRLAFSIVCWCILISTCSVQRAPYNLNQGSVLLGCFLFNHLTTISFKVVCRVPEKALIILQTSIQHTVYFQGTGINKHTEIITDPPILMMAVGHLSTDIRCTGVSFRYICISWKIMLKHVYKTIQNTLS